VLLLNKIKLGDISMKNLDVTRAWKDPVYRSSLTDEERASLPENPAGLVEVTDDDLAAVNGGTTALCSLVVVLTLALCVPASMAYCPGTTVKKPKN